MLYSDVVVTKFGALTLIATEEAITYLAFGIDAGPAGKKYLEKHYPGVSVDDSGSELLEKAITQIQAFAEGKRNDFDLPLAPFGTEFQQTVWKALSEIPFGETASYAEIAEKVDSVARAVGQANGQNPLPIIVPCHRVVASDGSLQGFVGGVGLKQALLHHESMHISK